jgi:hypothetical protein
MIIYKFAFDAFIASCLQKKRIYLIFVFETTFKGKGALHKNQRLLSF